MDGLHSVRTLNQEANRASVSSLSAGTNIWQEYIVRSDKKSLYQN